MLEEGVLGSQESWKPLTRTTGEREAAAAEASDAKNRRSGGQKRRGRIEANTMASMPWG